MRTKLGMIVVFAAVLVAGSAFALPMTFDLAGVNDPVNNTASVLFTYDPIAYAIHLEITNTSPQWDPRLTAFAFNAPSQVTGVSGFSGPTGWSAIFDANDINTPGQFGFFDVAGVTGPNFNGGFPNNGIPRSSTFAFDFTLMGNDLDLLSEMSFLGQFSYDPPGNPNENEQYFIARFQRTGPNGRGSDVAIPTGPPGEKPPGEPVPEPSTVLLLGAGLIGVARFLRSRGQQ